MIDYQIADGKAPRVLRLRKDGGGGAGGGGDSTNADNPDGVAPVGGMGVTGNVDTVAPDIGNQMANDAVADLGPAPDAPPDNLDTPTVMPPPEMHEPYQIDIELDPNTKAKDFYANRFAIAEPIAKVMDFALGLIGMIPGLQPTQNALGLAGNQTMGQINDIEQFGLPSTDPGAPGEPGPSGQEPIGGPLPGPSPRGPQAPPTAMAIKRFAGRQNPIFGDFVTPNVRMSPGLRGGFGIS